MSISQAMRSFRASSSARANGTQDDIASTKPTRSRGNFCGTRSSTSETNASIGGRRCCQMGFVIPSVTSPAPMWMHIAMSSSSACR